MSRIMVFTAERDLSRKLRLASDDDVDVFAIEQLPAGAAQTVALGTAPEDVKVVVLDTSGTRSRDEAALNLARRFDETMPQVSVVLVSDHAEEIALLALKAGARDVVQRDASVDELRWSLQRAIEGANERVDGAAVADSFAGRVITVASPKGGVGKTTVSTNLAVGLAREYPHGTVLVDLDIQFGDVAAALDLDPVYTLSDVLSGPVINDPIALKSLLTQHESGLHVLPGVRSPAESDSITAERIDKLLGLLKHEFRFVVLDTAPGLTDTTLAALDHTTDLVLVTSLDVPGVRGLRKELQLLDEIGLQPSTRHVVVNMVDRAGGLTIKDVEATIGRPVDITLRRSEAYPRSTNHGVPLVLSSTRGTVAKELMRLIVRFSPTASHAGLFGVRARGRART